MGSNKLPVYGVLFPSLGWRAESQNGGDDVSSCGGIRIQASVTETNDVSATLSSETVDLTIAA